MSKSEHTLPFQPLALLAGVKAAQHRFVPQSSRQERSLRREWELYIMLEIV